MTRSSPVPHAAARPPVALALEHELQAPARVPPLAGGSREALRLRELVQRVASTPRTTVLVTGPRGSGRRAVAREIHRRSAAAGPFAVLAAGSATERSLADALVACDAGSLVLHEVDRLASAVQTLLLDHLQERQGLCDERASSPGPRPRLVATTSRDLAERVAAGAFRDDLHYRINVLSLSVPALCERSQDLPELVAGAFAALASEHAVDAPALDPAALDALRAHAWPGNLAELGAVLEAAFLRALDGGVVHAAALGLAAAGARARPSEPAGSSGPTQATLELGDRSLRALEEALIRRVLVESSGNRSRAARVLGVNRATLYNKLKLYDI